MNVIAVWGSSGSGKTTVALALAAAIAKKRNDVLIISSDSRTPALPVYLPMSTDLTGLHSLGGVLEGQDPVSEASLKNHIHKHPQSEHIYFMGLVSGELPGITYKPPNRAAVAGLLQCLSQSPFAHIIIDCDASPIYDATTLYALEHAQSVLRVVVPDVKSYEFCKSQLAWLSNSDSFRPERHIKVANCELPRTPMAEAATLFGGFDAILPHAVEVGEHMIAGRLLSDFHAPLGIRFEREIGAFLARIEEKGDHDV